MKKKSKSKNICKSVKKKKKQTSAKDFPPPTWCGDPCPKGNCTGACVKSNEHGGVHKCHFRHTWS